MAFKGVRKPTEIIYFDLVEGDVIRDKSGNEWCAVEVTRTDSDQSVEFWLTEMPLGKVRKHHLSKPSGDTVTVMREPSRPEWIEGLEEGVDAAEAKTPHPDECGTCGLVGKHDEECSAVADAKADGDSTRPRPTTKDEIASFVARAESVVEEVAGGVVLATETVAHEAARERADADQGPMDLPPIEEFNDPEMRSHIFLVHGTYAHDLKARKALVALHAQLHADASHEVTPHNHDAKGFPA